MLRIAKSLSQLSFSKLMEVYSQSNQEKALRRFSREPAEVALRLIESETYQYLSTVFFRGEESIYAIWEEAGCYVSALRLERWQNGLLLTGLETTPDRRRQGYGRRLLRAALCRYPGRLIYSHVEKHNIASLALHEACGFRRLRESAQYLDGSIDGKACTMVYEG